MYDLIVIGGGPGGCEAAIHAAKTGRKILLIDDQKKIGGVCLHRGCIPTKSLLKSAHLFAECRAATALTGEINFDLTAAGAIRDQTIAQLSAGLAGMLKKVGVETLAARAEISAVGKVSANGQIYEAEHILIATGSSPAQPPIPGVENALTSDDFLRLEKLPDSAAIIGGGVIGLEIAAFFNYLQIPVTVIEMSAKIGGALDSEIAKRLLQALKKNGVNFHLENTVRKIAPQKIYSVDKNRAEQIIGAEMIIIAAGRAPQAANLGLEKCGVEFTSRGIKTDEYGRTSVEKIWAGGDCTGRCSLAHAAAKECLVVVENMFGGDTKMRYDQIPSVIYTSPEVASVGVTEDELKSTGAAYKKITVPLAVSGRYAIEFPEESGLLKILWNPENQQIFGAQIFGGAGGEIIHSFAMMLAWQIPAPRIREVIFPHPTIAESLAIALAQIG